MKKANKFEDKAKEKVKVKVGKVVDIFNITDLKGIPKSVVSNLRLCRKNETSKNIMELFELKRELNLNEIVIGLYKKFNLEKSRASITVSLTHLVSKKLLLKNDFGTYEKVKING